MRTLWKITTFAFLLFTLTACMPDSLTKFKEDSTKKGEDTTSSGGSGSSDSDDSVDVCTPGTDPACTSPGTFTYPDDKNYKFLINENGDTFELPTIAPSFSNYIEGHDEYLSFSTPTTFASDTGLTIDFTDESQFVGTPDRFLPKTFYDVTATYSSDEFGSDEISSDTFAITIAQDLESLIYPTPVGSKIILELSDVSPFSSQTGANYISAENGISGLITYIDTDNKELHIDISENTGKGFFTVDGEVDSSSAFFNSKATVEAVYNTFDRSTSIQSSLTPTVQGYSTLSSEELSSISYSIFPSLPAGLSFDQMRGTIGTLRAYQNVNDGTLYVTEGSREITGVGTLFLTHLQVNSTIEINGELHKIESIDSNSSAKTYSTFSTSASVTGFKKYLKGSVSTDSLSPILTGTGTAFSSEVITSKDIVIDSVSDFAGLTISSPINVSSDSQIILPGNAGTELTIPELKATSYVITAKNILGKTVSKLITISLLTPVQPKTLTKVAYNLEVGDKVALYASNVTSFIKDGYISNKAGTIAQVDYIDTSNNKLFATVRNIGNYCTVSTALTSTACTSANGLWLAKNFDSGDLVDNSSSFLAGETTLTQNAILSFNISSTAINRVPAISPELDIPSDELSTLSYQIEPDISSGQGFCSNATYKNQFDCTSNSGVWSQGLLFATVDQCSDLSFTNETDCGTATETWIKKGTFYGAPTVAIPETEFTITTTTLLDKSIESKLSLSVNTSPAGLAVTRNVLLHVPTAAAFDIGDAISSKDNLALGTVTGKFKVNALNTEKDTYLYEFLEVKIINGSFNEFDDLDNLPQFDSQETYVLGAGVYKYNTKLTVVDSSEFKDKDYSTYSTNENLLQVGGLDRARIMFNNEITNTLYVIVYDDRTDIAEHLEPTSISTGDTVTAVNVLTSTSIIPDTTINHIESNNVILTFTPTSYLGISSTSKGYDITSSGTGIGMLHYFDSSTKAKVEVTEGVFKTGEDLDTISPHSGDATETIDAVENDYTFYFYRGTSGSAEIVLDTAPSDTIIELDKDLPAGMSTELNDSGVFRISGTPTSQSVKEKFTLTASSAFGSTTYEFFIKVYNQLEVTDTIGSTSYILHKTGKGNGRRPCSITEEQMNYGDSAVNDITCFLDVDEDELHWNGIALEVKMGENLCTFIDEKPPAFWRFAPGASSDAPEATGTIYKHSGYSECTYAVPTALYTIDAAGSTSLSAHVTATPALDDLINIDLPSLPEHMCKYNFKDQYDNEDLPQCDEGVFPIVSVTWSPQEFVCLNGGVETSAADVDACGVCDTGEETQSSCVGTWTPYTNNSAGSNGGYDRVGTCQEVSQVSETDFECGGKESSCLAGPRTSWEGFDEEDIEEGTGVKIHNMSIGTPKPTGFTTDYTEGYEAGDQFTNIWFSNYYKACSVDSYKPNVTTLESNISGTPKSTSHLGDRASSTYEFVCRTAGTKGRIRIVVRDFDKDFKVKFGFCTSNPSITNESECNDLVPGDWKQSGIDYFDPDNLSAGTTDSLNFLFNSQADSFGDTYNNFNSANQYVTGGTCGTPTFDFAGSCSNSNYRDHLSCTANGSIWTAGAPTQTHPRESL